MLLVIVKLWKYVILRSYLLLRLTVGTSVRLVCSQCASLVPDMELHIPKHKVNRVRFEFVSFVPDIRLLALLNTR